MSATEPLLDIVSLTVAYGSYVAVREVSLAIRKGETLGLVGESGCGKSSLARAIMRLVDARPGKVLFRDVDILSLSKRELRAIRPEIQMIFQDPFSSLDPRFKVIDLIGEPLKHFGVARKERETRVLELMEMVGLSKAQLHRYPHEFSGGQRQRIGIARALALQPKLIVCDEPVSALDVSIQAQIINLLMDLREKFDITLLFISHDLGVVETLADRVAVMYRGHVVEIAPTDRLFMAPRHEYTRALLSASTSIAEERKAQWENLPVRGHIPAADTPSELVEIEPGHWVREIPAM